MKTPRQRLAGELSAAIVHTLGLIAAFSGVLLLSAVASGPQWWYDRGAVVPQFTTNGTTVTKNYELQSNAVVTVGQLKQFTARAVDELNSHSGVGAGSTLNNLVHGWSTEYASSNWGVYGPSGAGSLKPSDSSAATVGQLKWIGSNVWTQLEAAHFTNAVPSWLSANPSTDKSAAVIGQVKTVFNFDLSSLSGGMNPPIITSSSTAAGSIGVSFTYSITATQSPTSFGASGLPAGLAVNSSSGVISGTPTATGIYPVTLTATNSHGTGTGIVVITITSETSPPVINSSPALAGVVGEALNYRITATHQPNAYGASGLPGGLSVNSQTGLISGTPANAGTFNITLSATNSAGTGTAALVLSVTSEPVTGGALPVITSDLAATGTSGTLFSYQISATNDPASYNAAGLPSGLSVDASSGSISGTPTDGGNYSILISATNASGTGSAFLFLSLNYVTPVITSSTTASATAGTLFTYSIVASNDPTSYGQTGLPGGLTLNSTSGLIAGTPVAAGTYPVSLTATNATGTGSATLTLTVAPNPTIPPLPGPVITSSNVAYAEEGQAFSYTITASPTPSSYAATGLPSGFSINSGTGAITGMPATGQTGTHQVTISVTKDGLTTTGQLLLVIESGTAGILPKVVTYEYHTSPTSDYSFVATDLSEDDPDENFPNAGDLGLLPGDGIFRQIIGFNSLNLPSQATVTNVQLVTYTEVTGEVPLGTPLPTDPVTVQLYKASASLSKLSDLNTASVDWTNDSDPDSSVPMLGSQSIAFTSDFTAQTWPSNSDLVSLVQNEIAGNTPLFFLLRLSDADEANPDEIGLLLFNYNPSDVNPRPQLIVTYTLPLPPLIPDPSTIVATANQSFQYQVPQVEDAQYSAIGLPFGLTINPDTGLITGSTTETGGFTVTVAITTSAGTSTITLYINVGTQPTLPPFDPLNPAQPLFLTPGQAYSYAVPLDNTEYSGVLAFSAENLPAGLSIDPATGVISGTPEPSANPTVTSYVTVSSVFGSTLDMLIFNYQPTFGTPMTAIGDLHANFAYEVPVTSGVVVSLNPSSDSSATLTGLGLDAAYIDLSGHNDGPIEWVWGMASSTTGADGVPIGLVLNQGVTDGSATGTVNVIINPEVVPTFQTQMRNARQMDSFSHATSLGDSHSSEDTDHFTTVNYSAEGLPGGLSIDSNTGVISGTPNDTSDVPVTYTPTITAYSHNDTRDVTNTRAGTETMTIVVYPEGPWITSPLTADVDVGHAFSYQLETVYNDETAATATLTEGPLDLPPGTTLPPGLAFGYDSLSKHYVLSGTPTEAGSYTLALTATDSSGQSSATLILTVGSFSSASSAVARVNCPFHFQVVDDNGPTNFQASNFPPGTTTNPFGINSSTGLITGTPVTADTVPIGINVTDNAGVCSQVLTLTILPASTDSSASFQQGVSPDATYLVSSATIFSDTDSPSAAGTLIVGRTSSSETARALVGFDLSSLPANATITSAQLVMQTIAGVSIGDPVAVEVHQSLNAFDPASANWGDDSGTQVTVLSTANVNPAAAAGTSVAFPLTSRLAQTAQQAYRAKNTLYLTLLAPTAESKNATDAVGFATNTSDPTQNPKLVVTYTVSSPTVPTITSPVIAYGISGVPFSYTITANNAPTTFGVTGQPTGLTRAGAVISGTVDTVGTTVATVSAQNAAGTGTAQVTFNIDNPTPANGLQPVSGDRQAGLPSTFLSQPLVVTATRDGSPLPNALVTFSVAKNEGLLSLTNSGTPLSNALTVITDSLGTASAYLYLPTSLRTTTVLAVSGTAPAVSFQETSAQVTSVPDDGLIMLSILSGEGQSGTTSSALPFVVQATTVTGQPKASQQLALAVVQGGGGVSSSSSGTFAGTGTVTTDVEGLATIYLKPGGSDGTLNEASCVAVGGNAQPVVYLTAQTGTGSGTNPAPTPGGGSTPVTDPTGAGTPGGQPYTPELSITAGVNSGGDPDPTSITISIDPAPPSEVTSFQVDKKISTGQWLPFTTISAGGIITDSGLFADEDIRYRVTPVFGGYLGNPAEIDYRIPYNLGTWVSLSTAHGRNSVPGIYEDAAISNWGPWDSFYLNTDPGAGDGFNSGDYTALATLVQGLEHQFGPFSTSGPGGIGAGISVSDDDVTAFPGMHVDFVGGVDYDAERDLYNFTYRPCRNTQHSWYIAVNERELIPETDNVGPETTQGSTYSLNPFSYYSNGPVTMSLIEAASISVLNSGATLDDQEKHGMGSEVTVRQSGSFSFDATGGGEYSIGWTGSGFDVYGYQEDDNGNTVLVPVGNGETIEPEDKFTGSFVIVVKDPSQSQTTSVTCTAYHNDVFLNSDFANFYYNAPDPKYNSLTVPIDEASGPRYRKIALNGLPMPDEKPQQSAESDQEKEESYVDALTLGLHHSTTDVYLPVSGSDFSVSCRRDVRSQIWNDRFGLRPHEQPDLPFGMCWSSNLAPNIKFSHSDDPGNVSTPDQAIVTDETGAVHTFFWWNDGSQTQFFPMPTSKNEAQVPNLEALAEDDSTTPITYTFTRKYGETLKYEKTAFNQTITNDRIGGSAYTTEFEYARLRQATDRVGNVVNYSYEGTTNLIPKTISVANQPDIALSIEQQPVSTFVSGSTNGQSVITAIWDGNHNKTTFQYATAPQDTNTVVLTSVTAPDGAKTCYQYDQTEDDDTTPALKVPNSKYYFVDIKSIKDPLQNKYEFTYTLDHSKKSYMADPEVYVGYYIQPGCPRKIHTVTMPDQGADVATFVNNSHVQISGSDETGYTVQGTRKSVVTDATGLVHTYTFGAPDVVPLPSFPQSGGNITATKIVAYQSLNIAYGTLGSETVQFDINAAMALSKVIDFSGNTTTYAHGDTWTAVPTTYSSRISGATFNGCYDDPTKQTNALNQPKTFTYFGPNRIMKSVTDENLNKTEYCIDSLGRRTNEKIYDPTGALVQETDFLYGNSKYPGFMTQKTVAALGGSDPAFTAPLVTQYVPDTNGRVQQEIVDPNGLKLSTSYSYDTNGNKLTATDPRNNTTTFGYDSRNRLVTASYADGSEKRFVYDARGNKKIEYDENGNATLYNYDTLNRLTDQARDMNGNQEIDRGTDLVTSYTYNNANAKLTVEDPNGKTTRMQYDAMQRLTDTYDALNHHTHLDYGINSGGNAFDSSSFKPTHVVDPRGFTTDVTYDALYRPTDKAVEYDAGQPTSITSTTYDYVGNPVATTDPLTHQTKVDFDALNRPVRTTFADGTSSCAVYTSTGLKWKTVDENRHSAQTEYDGAGRPVKVTTGIISNAITGSCPVTKTVYDAAGNVAATINPLNQEWDYVYDVRNRKVQELEPALYNETVRPILGWQYDAAGRTVAVVDALGHETDTIYDAANRVTDVNQPAVVFNGDSVRPNTHTTYDLNGNVLTVQDPNTHTTTNCYDALNRLFKTTDAAGNTVTNGYDEVGNKTCVKDGDSQATSFAYDGLNRNTRITDAAGRSTLFAYDGLNKTSRTDALSHVATYQYDLRNRLQVVGYTGGGAANSPRIYAYDNVGNLQSVTEPAQATANVGYLYDAVNRVTSETSNGQTHTYSYDNAGNRLGVVYGGTGRTLTNTYDTLNRLISLQDRTPDEIGSSSPGRTTSYNYDLNGNIHAKTAPNGDTESYAYDALNRATNESVQSSSTTVYNCAYGYDRAGNVLTVAETYGSGLNNRTVTNSYDNANRLHVEASASTASTVTTTYTYDGANNRTDKSVATLAGGTTTTVDTGYSYNNLNQLTGYGDGVRNVTLAYDFNGNRTSRTITGGSDPGTDSYSYDFENRLVGLNKGTYGGTGTYSYQYDYRTRRVTRDETGASGANTAIVFSGGTSVQEYDDGSSGPSVEYLRGSDYGGGVGGILYTIRGTVERYTHANRRGDVVFQDASDTSIPAYQAQYDAYGKQIATVNPSSTPDRQKSNSKDTDPTGLVDEGFRYRDLDTGMFINRDPAGFVDGPNLYAYVRQNPWTGFDPEGLMTQGQYQDDANQAQAQENQAIRDYQSRTPMSQRTQKALNAVEKPYEDRISRDQEGIRHIDDLVATFNSYSSRVGGLLIDESAKSTIDDGPSGGKNGQYGPSTLGKQQYVALTAFSFGAMVSENAVGAAAGGAAGKGVGMGLEAASPYLAKVFAAFFKPAAKSAGQLGREGEALASEITGGAKNTQSYVVNGRTRIPDQVNAQNVITQNPSIVTEVKNVQYQSLSQQLRDYSDLVGPGGRVNVALPPGARVSGPLQRAFDDPLSPLNRIDLSH